MPTILGLEFGLYLWALDEPAGRGWWKRFAEGTFVQLANPKAAIFMVAFYPQFVPADRPLFATTAWPGPWCRWPSSSSST